MASDHRTDVPTAGRSAAAAGALWSGDDYVAHGLAASSGVGVVGCRAGRSGAGRNRSGFGAVVVLAGRRRSGHTGAVLGAAGVGAETVGPLTAAARW